MVMETKSLEKKTKLLNLKNPFEMIEEQLPRFMFWPGVETDLLVVMN